MAHTRGRIRAAAGLLATAALTATMFATGANAAGANVTGPNVTGPNVTGPNAAERDAAGTAGPRIVGGEPAQIEQHPWVVYLADPLGNQFCGGTLGAANKIITAAHCVEDTLPAQLRVVAGREDKTTTEGTEAGVTDVWVHPDYQSAISGGDVAVLTLDREVRAEIVMAELTAGSHFEPGEWKVLR